VRGGSRDGAARKGAAGRPKAKPAPKSKLKANVRLSTSSIKIEDDDDDEYRGPAGKKKSRTAPLDDGVIVVDIKSKFE
jgi:hypothetical protein